MLSDRKGDRFGRRSATSKDGSEFGVLDINDVDVVTFVFGLVLYGGYCEVSKRTWPTLYWSTLMVYVWLSDQ